MPCGASQQIDAYGTGSRQDVIPISFSITDAEDVGGGTAGARGENSVETVAPLLPFLLADGELCAPGPFADVVRVPGPDLLRQKAQGDSLWCDGSGGMDQQAVTGGVSQRPSAFGDASVRPVSFGRLVHGQDKRRRVASTRGRFYVTLEHIGGHNGIIGKRARGGFAHRAVATGCRQSGPGTLGERMGEFNQTLGAPQVAEFRVGKL